MLPFAEAEPGASSIELLLGLALHWGEQSELSLAELLMPITQRAAQVAGREARLMEGAPADLVLFDSEARWAVAPERLRSRGKRTPFAFANSGLELPGRVLGTWIAGKTVYRA